MNLGEKEWGALTHAAALLGILLPIALVLGPMVVWMIKRNESDFVNTQGKEAVNFQLTIVVASFILMFLSMVAKVFMLFATLLLLTGFIFGAIAAVNIYQGKNYRYPFAVRLIK